MPKETQRYVTSISARYNKGDGKPPEPTLEDIQAHTLALIPNANPDERHAALQEVTRQYIVHQQAVKDNEDYRTAQAIRALSKNGGNYLALPVDMINAIPEKDLASVQSFARSQQEGKRESNKTLYNHLTSNPDLLANLTEDQLLKLAPELSDGDFKHFSNQRMSLLKPDSGNAPDILDMGAVNAHLNNLLNQLNIDPTPKDSDEAGKVRLGTIRKFVNDSLLSAQAQTGKKFQDADINRKINELFAINASFRKSVLGFNTGTINKQLLTAKVEDIDSETTAKIKEAFKSHGIDKPTDGQILGAYFNGMSH